MVMFKTRKKDIAAMSLWIRKAYNRDMTKTKQVQLAISRILPTPFEERRSRIGVSGIHLKWLSPLRLSVYIVIPTIVGMLMSESRDMPYVNCFTAIHIWFADHGLWRHDTIKALNPAFEVERQAYWSKASNLRYYFTGFDQASEKEGNEFAAMNLERHRARAERSRMATNE
jgi:hypothetical protein